MYYEGIGYLNASKISSFNLCGCEMSQCLLPRMTLLFLSLSEMRFDFLDVTVSIWAWLPSAILFLLVLFIPPLLSEVMNMKSEEACVAASSLSSTVFPKYKRDSPRFPRLIPSFTTCISRVDFSEPLLMMTKFFFFLGISFEWK